MRIKFILLSKAWKTPRLTYARAMKLALALTILALTTLTPPLFAQQAQKARSGFAYPPKLDGAREEVYRRVGDVALKVWIFEPQGHSTNKPLPAIVFFFGGGWQSGSPAQFERQCRHLASRGMVAITADYRVGSRHKVRAADCVADAKSAIRWVRANAARLGIDPERIAAGGGSAGGHLAGATGTLPTLDAAGEDTAVSSRPNALVLFNPALVLAPIEGVDLSGFVEKSTAERFGCEPVAISPAHHIVKGTPPTLILHGTADSTVPFATAKAFADRMKAAGNRCELVAYEGQPHGFFNAAKYEETLAEADRFLVSLGWLKSAP